ncbi:MAG TPA: SPASM domain-containing protein, partial [Mesotoga sp.]|nr:SPASM domain-containing protein [Mesotoga sp.]
ATLPDYCHRCEYLFACHGECPKNRFVRTLEGEAGLNYLCSGLKLYFSHIDPYMKELAEAFRSGR